MEGTLVLNYILLFILFCCIGFPLGMLARAIATASWRRADDEELRALRQALADIDGRRS